MFAIRWLLAIAAPVALAGCVTAAPPQSNDTCKAEPGQRFIGQTATAAIGSELLVATKARELRWLPPGMVVTMEYKYGRLNVAYDEAMKIVHVICG